MDRALVRPGAVILADGQLVARAQRDVTDGVLLNYVLAAGGVTLPSPPVALDLVAADEPSERALSRVGIYSLLEPAANPAFRAAEPPRLPSGS